MNITEQTIKGLQENQETAIKLLKENVELKKRIKEAIDYIKENLQSDTQRELFDFDKLQKILEGDKNE